MDCDNVFMQRALELAKLAAARNEVPVGALVVSQGEIIAMGHNRALEFYDATAHAEIIAMRRAGKRIKNYRLVETTLYVTLEPCVMCVGAMVHFRIGRLVFGAQDLRFGAVISKFRLLDQPFFNHSIEFTAGVMAKPCGDLLRGFFKQRRHAKHGRLAPMMTKNSDAGSY